MRVAASAPRAREKRRCTSPVYRKPVLISTRPDAQSNRVRAVMSIAIEGERSGVVVRALQGLPEVSAIHTTNGRWDLIADLDVETLADFSVALDRIRQLEGIAATETSILLATHKF